MASPLEHKAVGILAHGLRRNTDKNSSLLNELPEPQVHSQVSTSKCVDEENHGTAEQNACSLYSLPPELRMEIFKLVIDDYSMSKRSYYRNSFRNVNSDTFEIWTGNEVFRGSDSRKMLDRLPAIERALIGDRTLYREVFSTRIENSTIRLWAKLVGGDFQFPDFEGISPLLRKSIRKVIISARCREAKPEDTPRFFSSIRFFLSETLPRAANLRKLTIHMDRMSGHGQQPYHYRPVSFEPACTIILPGLRKCVMQLEMLKTVEIDFYEKREEVRDRCCADLETTLQYEGSVSVICHTHTFDTSWTWTWKKT